MTARYIDRFRAIAFDMNGTFMFDEDRFGHHQDYFSTYRASGGVRLDRGTVHDAVTATIAGLAALYAEPGAEECFPSLRDAIDRFAGIIGEDAASIENVIAAHECGRIPEWSAEVLHALSKTHRLAIVSNLWALPDRWENEFARTGIEDVFKTRVFSSTLGSIKPSLVPFRRALDAMRLTAEQVLFVGDSLERDIRPAKSLGMGTVWITANGSDTAAERCAASIVEMLQLI
jgi:putative hydrolase of the HAD superfamily